MKSFVPHKLPLDQIDWGALVSPVGKANLELGNLHGALKGIVNPGVLLSPLTLREAVLSSKIEGTQATLQEVLFYEALPDENNPRYDDIQEVINYRKTLAAAEKAIGKKPMHLNMLLELHEILMDSVRGENQRPGTFREIQNWIGPKGCTIDQAYYVPPEPAAMKQALGNWEKYWHYQEKDPLIQLAILHAQFEIIHPFRDGNGRIGRVLIPLFLAEKGILDKPVFYLSEYLESHREEYYSGLRGISETGNWDNWLQFFLKAFTVQAISMRGKAESIISLYDDMKREIFGLNSTFALLALDALFTMPIFTSSDFVKYTDIPRASANRLLGQIQEKGIISLISEGQGRTPNTYSFHPLLLITETPLEHVE